MIIHLIQTCSAFKYDFHLSVKSYEISSKLKGNAIILIYNERELTIPLSNIAAIEE